MFSFKSSLAATSVTVGRAQLWGRRSLVALAVMSLGLAIGCQSAHQSPSSSSAPTEAPVSTTPQTDEMGGNSAEPAEPSETDPSSRSASPGSEPSAEVNQASFDDLALNIDSYETVVAKLGEPTQTLTEEAFTLNTWVKHTRQPDHDLAERIDNTSVLQMVFDSGKVWYLTRLLQPEPEFEAIQLGMDQDEVLAELGQPFEQEEMLYSSFVWEDEASEESIKAVFIHAGYSFSDYVLRAKSYQNAQGEVVMQGLETPSWDSEL